MFSAMVTAQEKAQEASQAQITWNRVLYDWGGLHFLALIIVIGPLYILHRILKRGGGIDI